MIAQIARMKPYPDYVTINMLRKVEGTPMQVLDDLYYFDFIRTLAVARITMPSSHVRLSAGREVMSEEMQSLCFLAGANSIFYGEKLLTTGNTEADQDKALFEKLGIRPEVRSTPSSRRMANA